MRVLLRGVRRERGGEGGESVCVCVFFIEKGIRAPVIKTTLRIFFIISTTIDTIPMAHEQQMTFRVD